MSRVKSARVIRRTVARVTSVLLGVVHGARGRAAGAARRIQLRGGLHAGATRARRHLGQAEQVLRGGLDLLGGQCGLRTGLHLYIYTATGLYVAMSASQLTGKRGISSSLTAWAKSRISF